MKVYVETEQLKSEVAGTARIQYTDSTQTLVIASTARPMAQTWSSLTAIEGSYQPDADKLVMPCEGKVLFCVRLYVEGGCEGFVERDEPDGQA